MNVMIRSGVQKSKKRAAVMIASLAALMTGCSPALSLDAPQNAGSAETPSEKPKFTVTPLPEDADPAIWVLRDDDTTIYLFGTIHLLPKEVTWFDEAVKEAFDRSDELVIEMIPPPAAESVQIIHNLTIDKSGVSLREKLSKEDRMDYEEALTKYSLPLNSFDPIDPWYAAINLSLIPLNAGGYNVSAGAETVLINHASAQGKKISGLENFRQQLGFFDNLPAETQISFLNQTVDTLDETKIGIDNLVAEWANGNIVQLAALNKQSLPDKILYKVLLTDRNKNWSQWIAKRMDQPGIVFLAVGSAHLVGEDSVIEILSDQGKSITRIEY